MKTFVLALVLAACTPDDSNYPVMPGGGTIPPSLGFQHGPDASPTHDAGPTSDAGDAGLRDGGPPDVLTILDSGLRGDAGVRLDSAPPDATALTP